MRRFYLCPLTGNSLNLEGDEAHHARAVLRAREGAELMLFDGLGHERPVRVRSVARHRLELEPLGDPTFVDRRPGREIHVALAFPKARGRGLVIEKLVELGARSLRPLLTRRGTPPPKAGRLGREIRAACKQCGINHLPEIRAPLTVPQLVEIEKLPLIWLDPQGASTTPTADPICLLIGPEGGFTPEELPNREGSCWNLGAAILRVETAALVALARLGAP